MNKLHQIQTLPPSGLIQQEYTAFGTIRQEVSMRDVKRTRNDVWNQDSTGHCYDYRFFFKEDEIL